MLYKRLGILGTFAFLPAFAQVSTIPVLQQTFAVRAPRYHGPVRDVTDHGDGTSSSINWSGYAVLGSSFTWAKGSWVVPTATCSGVRGAQYSSFWVGLDGAVSSSQTVEQTGTDSDCAGSTPTYYAWYEFYPAASVPIPNFAVHPGDVMSALVYYKSSTNRFITQITNETTGKTFSTSGAVSGAIRSTAEWIAEAPCCTFTGGILPLADFGTVSFGKDASGVANTNDAKDTSTVGPIGAFPAVNQMRFNKVGSSTSPQTSTCSTLSTDGTSFTCTWAP